MISVRNYGSDVSLSEIESGIPYVIPSLNLPEINGSVRVNGTELEVFNAGYWQPYNTTLLMETSHTLTEVVVWASNKIAEERQRAQLIEKHSCLQLANDAIIKAQ